MRNEEKHLYTFGERLRQYRESNRWSQEELGDRLGLVKQAVSYYENGTRVPKIDTLQGIANTLKINPMWLLGYDVPRELDNDACKLDMTRFSPAQRYVADNLKNLNEGDALALQQILRRIKRDEGSDL